MEKISEVQPVILCGGAGTRLWPLSRAGFPKQFLSLTGGDSLFQGAAKRAASVAGEGVKVGLPYVVTNNEHRFLAAEQLREIGLESSGILLEPEGRNTAPALTLAALAASEESDPILLVCSADQSISDTTAFVSAVRRAAYEADGGHIVVLGVKPDRAETAYGYIQISSENNGIFEVVNFTEKPDYALASSYLTAGGYFWNAGIFILKASTWLNAIKRFRKDIFDMTSSAWEKRTSDMQFVRPGEKEFSNIPSESIDYAVMERCPVEGLKVKLAYLDTEWSDLGSWDSVWANLPKDERGNVAVGDVLNERSKDNLVYASSRLVAAMGVDNLVIVETPDVVLVADKSSSQDIKMLVDNLSKNSRAERLVHRKVHRPWGWYDCLDEGNSFKVKRIFVNPKGSLSLQKHFHRAEHWVVVHGSAEVTCGDSVKTLHENESTYIPLGVVHRLRNPGEVALELIEVQSGDWLSEEDIVRIEDGYGRL